MSARTPLVDEGLPRHRPARAWSGPRPPRRGWVPMVPAPGARYLSVVCSALALLVAQVLADHHDPPVAADHFALVADLLDARLDLHGLRLRYFSGLLVP